MINMIEPASLALQRTVTGLFSSNEASRMKALEDLDDNLLKEPAVRVALATLVNCGDYPKVSDEARAIYLKLNNLEEAKA